MAPLLDIEDLHVSVDGIAILNGVNLVIEPGTVHALMGPTAPASPPLAATLIGHPTYEVTRGRSASTVRT